MKGVNALENDAACIDFSESVSKRASNVSSMNATFIDFADSGFMIDAPCNDFRKNVSTIDAGCIDFCEKVNKFAGSVSSIDEALHRFWQQGQLDRFISHRVWWRCLRC